jgi:hypothetical protein
MEDQGLQTHLWGGSRSRQIEIDGKSIVLYYCPKCSRNFAREPGGPTWKAVSVSTFHIEVMPDSVSQKWISEPCPDHPGQDDTFASSKELLKAAETEPPSQADVEEPSPRRRRSRPLVIAKRAKPRDH